MKKNPQRKGSALTAEQVRFLILSGEFTSDELFEVQRSIARGELAADEERTRQSAINASLDASEVASVLTVDVETIDRMAAAGSLFAFAFHGERRYPTWQFTGDPQRPVLPGLAELTSALRDDRHPASILGFMTTPQRSARTHGRPTTPIEWLMNGGDPQKLRDILESFLQS